METRETKKLSCPSGKEVEIKTYLTTRERDQVNLDLVGSEKVATDGSPLTNFSINGLIKSQQTIVKIMVISYDGNSENCFDRLYDGRPEDYDFISDELGKVMQESLKSQPKQPMNGGATSGSEAQI